MHPDIGIVCMDVRPDGLSKIPDDPNTPTFQYAGTNSTPRESLNDPVKVSPYFGQTYLTVYTYLSVSYELQ